ncbi:MAG: PqqD family peptide modification chaperone [Lachnospiraceae bacterium]|nr:PqqD family peptide modification chaperone [Lachnospiraceae bacterium]
MQRNPDFLQIQLQNGTYLLPVGQSVSDLKPTLKLNGMGTYLWQLLCQDRTVQELCALCAEHFSVPSDRKNELRQDILGFLDALNDHGMLLMPFPTPDPADPCCHTLSIAGITLNLHGPKEVFSEQFEPFYIPHIKRPTQDIVVLYGSPIVHENGMLLIRNRELAILELSEKYILLFSETSCVRELHLKKDGSLALFYCVPKDTLTEDLFHAMRFAFLYVAELHGILAIHSASILYRDRAWLFSAPSGTGKSTHAALWHNILHTPYLNGDLNLITSGNGISPEIHGLPWCGTSGISDTATHPLGGVIFLKQAPTDSIVPLHGDDRVLALTRRLISPCWDSTMVKQQLHLAGQIAEHILLCRLFCTPMPTALDIIHAEIDRYLDASNCL